MSRTTKPDGSEFTAKNGYSYRKVAGRWKPKHYCILEEKLGREIDPKEERVTFIDKDRTNLDPDNLLVQPIGSKDTLRSKERRRDTIVDKIRELQAELILANEEIDEMKNV